MKVALVEPWHEHEEFKYFTYLPSYALPRLAAMCSDCVVLNGSILSETEILDAVENGGFDLVGVSAQTPHRHAARKILQLAKQRGATTIVGGYHATSQPHFFDRHYIDHIVRGEGEYWWRQIIRGEIVPRPTPFKRGENLNDYPPTDWSVVVPDIFLTGTYDPQTTPMHVATSYGCIGHCTYCLARTTHGKLRMRSPEHVRPELEYLYTRGARRYYVIDECFGHDREWAFSMCGLFSEFDGMRWSAFGRVGTIEPILLDKMVESGCCALIVGFESADQELLNRVGKGDISVGDYPNIIKWCRERGITLSSQFMYGLPYETDEHLKLTSDFIEEYDLHKETLDVTWVMPGMPLYEQCKKAGLIDDTFWDGDAPYYVYDGGLKWSVA